MSEQRQNQQRGQQQSPLQSDRGRTTIEDTAVSKIAGVAAQEVEKVQMGGGAAAAVSGFLGSVTGTVTGGDSTGGGSSLTSGVSVEVGEEEAAVDLTMAVEYGVPIPQTIEGDYTNVVGLPLALTSRILEEYGVRWY